MAPPRIKGRGQRGASVPGGVLWGRMPGARHGDLQPIRIQDLKAFGVGAPNEASETARVKTGFGFRIGGLMLAGESIGSGFFTRDVTFTDGDPDVLVTSLTPAAITCHFVISAPDPITHVPTEVGRITFAAGSTNGVVTWTGGVLLLLTGTIITLFAPTPADLTLADITGVVTGVGA